MTDEDLREVLAEEIPAPTCPTIDKIIALLEQLRYDNANLRMGGSHWKELYDEKCHVAAQVRAETVEEAAKVADSLKDIMFNQAYHVVAYNIAKQIRALLNRDGAA